MKDLRRLVLVTFFLLLACASNSFSQSWSSLTNPSGALTLSMGSDTSEFNFNSSVACPTPLPPYTPLTCAFNWENTTAATSSTNQQDSPTSQWCGNYWYVNPVTGIGQSEPDCWTFQNTMAQGLTFTHTVGQTNPATNGALGSPHPYGLILDSSMNTLSMFGQLSIGLSPGLPTAQYLGSQSFIAMTEGNPVGTAIGSSFIAAFFVGTKNGVTYTGPFTGMGLSHNGSLFYPIANTQYNPAPHANDCANYTGNMRPVLGDAGGPCATTLFGTQSNGVSGNISSTTMLTPSVIHDYLFTWTVSLTAPGTNCYGTTTVLLNVTFTDPNASSATTVSIGTLALAYMGNGTAGYIGSGTLSILAKANTDVSYNTSGYNPGPGCTTYPTYQVSPALVQVW